VAQKVWGPTKGLKAAQRNALERVYRRHVPTEQVVTTELAHFMAELSHEIGRQVGVLIDRRGKIQHVIIGDSQSLFLPELGRHRAGGGRLRGLRLIHTHVRGEALTRDDLTDLSLLRLDLVGVLQIDDHGDATTIELAHIVPPGQTATGWEVLPPQDIGKLDLHFRMFIEELELQLGARKQGRRVSSGTRAIVVHVTKGRTDSTEARRSLEEIRELARTAGIDLVEEMVQRRPKADPRYVLGRGKLEQLVLASMQQEVELIIFDRNLTPAQARSIAEMTEIAVIDRTQLILDIFARHAKSKKGKLQVELAQLRYTLPRLIGHGIAMSRLAGGIGGRGPGETKLELDRRRAKDRIVRLQEQIQQLSKQREQQRRRRVNAGVPSAAIIGYTNAGKSTLLNTLTGAKVIAENKLFATLDPTTRRLFFEDGREVVLTDTVGFIRDLPSDLIEAFKATLEELSDADFLVHVVDIGSVGWEDRVQAVRQILEELNVQDKSELMIFNKADQMEDKELLQHLCTTHHAIAVSAPNAKTLRPLKTQLRTMAGTFRSR
jgi:GTP-binding protein HflX